MEFRFGNGFQQNVAEMSAYTWDEDEQRVVTTAFLGNDSDSPITAQSPDPLAAWEIVDDDGIEKDQADHKFDLSILFNFAPRDGKGSGSGFDDAGSLKTFATGTSQLTAKIGIFNDPNFQIIEDETVEFTELEPPVEKFTSLQLGSPLTLVK